MQQLNMMRFPIVGTTPATMATTVGCDDIAAAADRSDLTAIVSKFMDVSEIYR